MWRKLNSMHMLQTHAPAIFLVIVSILMRFRPFSTVHTKTIWTPFSFDPDFHERYQIDAFSIKTLSDLVRTESLNASKCMRKRKTSTKCKRKRISIFVPCISISRTELQIFSKIWPIKDLQYPPPLPPKILHNFVFAFSWDDCNTQETLRNIALQNLGG